MSYHDGVPHLPGSEPPCGGGIALRAPPPSPRCCGGAGACAPPPARRARALGAARRERLVAQAIEAPPALAGHLRRQLGSRLRAEVRRDVFPQLRQAEHPVGSARLPGLMPPEVDRLANRQDDELLPEVFAIFEAG